MASNEINNFFTSYNLLAKSISQIISHLLANCFTFCTKFWMLQVRKSRFCGISAISFQCCFMSETQILMAVSNFCNFSFFFSEGGEDRGPSVFTEKEGWKNRGQKNHIMRGSPLSALPSPPLCDTLSENSRQQVNWDFTTEFTSKCTWSIVVKNSFKCFVSTTFNFNVIYYFQFQCQASLCNQFDCDVIQVM